MTATAQPPAGVMWSARRIASEMTPGSDTFKDAIERGERDYWPSVRIAVRALTQSDSEKDELRGIVQAVGEARDAAGYLGTAADCIRVLSKDSEALAEIEAMLLDGQGDDDGPQILPDFGPDWSTVAKVEACLLLLEKRRDALVGAPQPHSNMTISALARARDVMSAVADRVEHQGLTEQAQILSRQADDIRATLAVLIRAGGRP